jgi:hypothetical protein
MVVSFIIADVPRKKMKKSAIMEQLESSERD